jgi:EAL domain-containing protein (putative c-di-GMP-specific phosphodiesterase class I)
MHQFGASLIESALLHPDNFKVNVNGGYYSLSGSLGSAIFEPAEQSFEVILGILEHAVRSAKKRAPFGLCHIARDGIEEYDRVMAIQERVHSLSGSGELSLAFQPQFNAAAKIVGFEALIRWQSAEFGWVSPADFIPIAEENGAIFSIGEWVVASACDAAIELMSHGHHCTISINVSARQIVEPEFVLFLNRTLEEKQVPAQWLVLELTETALVSDMSQVKNTMQELAKLGFQFSVDDFGTGYSSLAYLKELPISELKVDKYFVDDITDDSLKSEYVIVDAIINMAQALGVKCVAEGVENKVQCNYLERVGCSIFQGYYYSRPLEIKDWRRLLLTGEFND